MLFLPIIYELSPRMLKMKFSSLPLPSFPDPLPSLPTTLLAILQHATPACYPPSQTLTPPRKSHCPSLTDCKMFDNDRWPVFPSASDAEAEVIVTPGRFTDLHDLLMIFLKRYNVIHSYFMSEYWCTSHILSRILIFILFNLGTWINYQKHPHTNFASRHQPVWLYQLKMAFSH